MKQEIRVPPEYQLPPLAKFKIPGPGYYTREGTISILVSFGEACLARHMILPSIQGPIMCQTPSLVMVVGGEGAGGKETAVFP